MENAQQTLAQAHQTLQTVNTNEIPQPHKDVFESVIDVLLKLLPIVIGLFHHATSQPPVVLPPVTTPVKIPPTEQATTNE